MSDKWDLRFLALTRLVSGWSKDPSTKVGAVLVDGRHRVISLGFNGLPHGVSDSDERLQNRETKLRTVIHAEENALLFASRTVVGATCYVWPLLPCARCASKLIQSGVGRVVGPKDGPDHWAEENALAVDLMREAGIDVEMLGPRDAEMPERSQNSQHDRMIEELRRTGADRGGEHGTRGRSGPGLSDIQQSWAKRRGIEKL